MPTQRQIDAERAKRDRDFARKQAEAAKTAQKGTVMKGGTGGFTGTQSVQGKRPPTTTTTLPPRQSYDPTYDSPPKKRQQP